MVSLARLFVNDKSIIIDLIQLIIDGSYINFDLDNDWPDLVHHVSHLDGMIDEYVVIMWFCLSSSHVRCKSP